MSNAYRELFGNSPVTISGVGRSPADSRRNDGAIYNPGSDTWSSVSPSNPPQARALHAAVWTGTEMIVWGGEKNGKQLNTGARYNPAGGIWTPTTQENAPGKRMFSGASCPAHYNLLQMLRAPG